MYLAKGEYDCAESFLRRNLELEKHALGPDSPGALASISNLSLLYCKTGNNEMAEAYLRLDLEACKRTLGPHHPDTGDARLNLANFLSDQGRHGETIQLRRQILAMATMNDGRNSICALGAMHRLAEDLYWSDALKESEKQYREALAGYIENLGNENIETMAARFELARCLSDQGCFRESIELRRIELEWCRKQGCDQSEGRLASIHGLAIDLRETDALDEAESLFRELLSAQLQVLDREDFEIGRALGDLAKTLEQAGKLEEAAVYAQQALEHRLAHEGPEAWWTNVARFDLALVLQAIGRELEAINLLIELEQSLATIEDPDEQDQALKAEALELRSRIEAGL